MIKRRREQAAAEGGFTLIELIVASAMLLVVMGLALTTVTGVSRSASRTRTQHDLNEEGRNALNRMARELRQAKLLSYAVNPDAATGSATGLVALSFRADFNGDGCAGNSCAGTNATTNPESITYCFNPTDTDAVKRTYLWLIPSELTSSFAGTSCEVTGAVPVLAGNVKSFTVEYRSNEYRYDLNPSDGITTWHELDDAPPPVGDVGVSDNNINTNALASVNSVVLHLGMGKSGLAQDYTTQIDLRNKS